MDDAVNKTWKEKPGIIRSYYDSLPIHKRMCDEVNYILERKIKDLQIKIGSLSSRAKTLESVCEKIDRKKYKDINQVTDFSGVRIVFLYSSDRNRLEKLVEEEFEIKEKVDKFAQQGVEQFGYGALHYIVNLKEQHAGARYDDLREVSCEIQIRTILQDAWAVVAHHLSYKHEEDIPNELRRKLHALSGLFEIADDQFEGLNRARTDYQSRLTESIRKNSELSLDADVNLDSLLAYLAWRFPNRTDWDQESAADLLQELNKFNYKKLKEIDDVVKQAFDAVIAKEKEYPPSEMDSGEPTNYNGIGIIRNCLEFIDEVYFKFNHPEGMTDTREEFSYLIKKIT